MSLPSEFPASAGNDNLLRYFLDGLHDFVYMKDLQGRYLAVNQAGAEFLGMAPGEIIGKDDFAVFSPDQARRIVEQDRAVYASGGSLSFEEEIQGHDQVLFLQAIKSVCRDSSGNVIGLVGISRNVGERKRLEETLLDSEARYRKLFESNMMGIGRPDRFGGFKDGNDELLRIAGYSREDLEAGRVRWDTMTPPEYAAIDAAHIAEAAKRGSCTPYEKEYIRKDGTRIPILCGYALLEGSQDEYIGFVFDLSRQRATEAAVREREQRFGVLAEVLPELVWVSDPVGSLIYLNQRFLDYCGIPPERAVGFDWRTFLHPEEVERVIQAWMDAVATGEQYLIELRMRRKDGAFRYFLARALAMRNEAGAVERWVGSCTDIHDQKLAEEALRRSEKLAATGRLAASIAHEINNPLSSVVNALYLALQDKDLSPKTREFLQTADEELARVSHITTQTLRFHRQAKAAAWADLAEIMQSVLTLFRPRLMARGIDIFPECQAGTRICCFEDEMRQVFANLVGNALDAMQEPGRLLVRVRAASSAGVPGVRVTVADTGCGIPRDIQHRIFEPFFSTKDTVGIGLGLWVTEGILRKHSGQLSLRSSTAAMHHGTVFALFFPQNAVE